jgi:hypothetical protein
MSPYQQYDRRPHETIQAGFVEGFGGGRQLPPTRIYAGVSPKCLHCAGAAATRRTRRPRLRRYDIVPRAQVGRDAYQCVRKGREVELCETHARSGEVPMPSINCPSDIALAAWCDQRLSGEAKNVITTHLVSCSDCRRVAIVVCLSIEREELELGDSHRLTAVVGLLRTA